MLTPQQMYEAVKRYQTYVAHNKRLEGKGTSSSTSQQKATDHTLGYKPRFHKTMAFAATIAESEDDGPCCQESSSQEGANPFGAELSQEDDEGLFISSYLEEALPDDPVPQVKMACAMQAQEVETRRCFTCNQQGHLQRDHWKYEGKNGNGPLQLKGPPLNKSVQERVKLKLPPLGQTTSVWVRHLLMMSWPPVSWTMELNSISLLLPMSKKEGWTLCPWTIWHKRLGDLSHSSEA